MTKRQCPICNKEVVDAGAESQRFHPFCSKRCADVDLGRWLTGRYAAPAEEVDMPDIDDRGAFAEEADKAP